MSNRETILRLRAEWSAQVRKLDGTILGLKRQNAAALRKQEELQRRLRETCQTLVEAVGAHGPCNAEDVAVRASDELGRFREEVAALRTDLETTRRERDDMEKGLEEASLPTATLQGYIKDYRGQLDAIQAALDKADAWGEAIGDTPPEPILARVEWLGLELEKANDRRD